MSDEIDLSEFEKREKVGESSFKKVFKIADKTGNVFAAQISKKKLEDDQKSKIINLKSEISTLMQLSCSSVLKFIGYSPKNFKDKSYPTIITEFSSNGSLKEVINLKLQSKSLSNWNDTTKLINIFGIASGMSYLHENGIIHGHLKTSSILEDENLFPKISNYWLSKLSFQKEDDEASHPDIYTPPENLNDNNYTKEGDVYSFAMIIYEIFSDTSPSSYFNESKISQGDRPEFNFPIPDCYKKLIIRCWSQNPSKRPKFDQIVEELQNNEDFTEKVDKNQYQNYIKNFTTNKQNSIEKVTIEFKQIEGFDLLSSEIQAMFIQAFNESSSSNEKSIFIPSEKVKELSSKKLFQKAEFSKSLCCFYKIVIEVNFPDENFESILFDAYDNYLWYKNSHDIVVNIVANSDLFNLREFLISNPEYEFFVVISSSIDELEPSCFCDCYSLYHITIPSSISTIPDEVFQNCVKLTNIKIPNSVTSICSSAFSGCKSLTNIEIPNSVTAISSNAFSDCESLTNIEIPNSVTSICSSAFSGCESLTNIEIPNSVTSICSSAFSGCESLTNITIPNSVTSICSSAFCKCSSLIEIEIPPSAEIFNWCFRNCSSLERVVLSPILKTLYELTFYECSSLKEIEIPSNVTQIKNSCFCNCKALEKVSFVSPSSLEMIDINAFSNCSALKEINFPSNVKSIGRGAFSGCSSLEKISYDENSKLDKIDCLSFSKCTSLKEIIFPPSLTTIGKDALCDASSLVQITVPASVKKKPFFRAHVGISLKVKVLKI